VNALPSDDTRTSNGDRVPIRKVKRPEVRPDAFPPGSIWDAKKSWMEAALHLLGLGTLLSLPIGVIAALVYIICRLLKADGIDQGQKIVAVLAIALMLTILGMATLLVGSNTHAKTTENNSDQSADA